MPVERSAVVTTRITPHTRAGLEAEAKRTGSSVSGVAAAILRAAVEGFERPASEQPNGDTGVAWDAGF